MVADPDRDIGLGRIGGAWRPEEVRPGIAPGKLAPRPAFGASDNRVFRGVAVVDVPGKVDVRRLVVVTGGAILCLDGLGVTPGAALLPAGGVLVREVDVLEIPLLPSCFVGDLAGECKPPAVRAPEVGLPTMALPLLPGASAMPCLFTPLTAVCTLLGLALGCEPLTADLALGFVSSSTWRTPAGLQNMP